jgi:hypothetical protein
MGLLTMVASHAATHFSKKLLHVEKIFLISIFLTNTKALKNIMKINVKDRHAWFFTTLKLKK